MIPTLTPDYVTGCLRRSGCLSSGAVTAVVPAGDTDDGLLRFDVLYDADADAGLPRRFLLKPNLKGDGYGASEVAFYRRIAPDLGGPVGPPTFDVGFDEPTGRSYVLQEDLSDSHRTAVTDEHPPTVEGLAAVVDRIARVHAACWDRPIIEEPPFVAPRGDISDMAVAACHADLRSTCDRILDDRLPRLFRIAADRLPSGWLEICNKSVDRWPNLYTVRMGEGALTLIHADLHPWNVFVPRAGEGTPLIFDWELMCRGIGVYDLSYLLLRCRLDPAERRRFEDALIPRYHRCLRAHGVAGYDLETCRADYRLSIVANILPPLAWGRPANLISTMEAFFDWDCAALD